MPVISCIVAVVVFKVVVVFKRNAHYLSVSKLMENCHC